MKSPKIQIGGSHHDDKQARVLRPRRKQVPSPAAEASQTQAPARRPPSSQPPAPPHVLQPQILQPPVHAPSTVAPQHTPAIDTHYIKNCADCGDSLISVKSLNIPQNCKNTKQSIVWVTFKTIAKCSPITILSIPKALNL